MAKNKEPRIKGGYILYPRKFLEILEEATPLEKMLWTWMYCQANHTNADGYYINLRRGQLLTSTNKIREALAWKSGYRTEKPSLYQIRRALDNFRDRKMINITKVRNGMVITIRDYNFYQQPKNYEKTES